MTTRKLLQEWRLPPSEPVFALAWNLQGTLVAVGRKEKPILLCRIDDPDCQVLEGHSNRVYGVAFSPDGKQLFSASLDKTIKVWDVATCEELRQIGGQKGSLLALAMDAEGRILGTAEGNGPIRLWDLDSHQPCPELQTNPATTFACLAFRPGGEELAAGGPSSQSIIHIWNMVTRTEIVQCRGHKSKVTSVVWSPDGKRLASSSDDGTLRLWEPKSGRLLLTLHGHKGTITAAAFSADGQLLISTGWDGAVRVWDGTPIEAPRGKQAAIAASTGPK